MLNIQEAERTGKSGRTYKQYFVDGKLVGCGCDQAVALAPYGNKPCCHMTGKKVLVTALENDPFFADVDGDAVQTANAARKAAIAEMAKDDPFMGGTVEQERVAVSCEVCGRLTYKPDGVCGKCCGW